MTETKRIARGTDLTLIITGVLMIAAGWAWNRYGTGRYVPTALGIAVLGVVCVLAGVAIIGFARIETRRAVGTHRS